MGGSSSSETSEDEARDDEANEEEASGNTDPNDTGDAGQNQTVPCAGKSCGACVSENGCTWCEGSGCSKSDNVNLSCRTPISTLAECPSEGDEIEGCDHGRIAPAKDQSEHSNGIGSGEVDPSYFCSCDPGYSGGGACALGAGTVKEKACLLSPENECKKLQQGMTACT